MRDRVPEVTWNEVKNSYQQLSPEPPSARTAYALASRSNRLVLTSPA